MTKNQFKALRKKLEYSQSKLAQALGVNITTVQRYEWGEFEIPRAVELALKQIESETRREQA